MSEDPRTKKLLEDIGAAVLAARSAGVPPSEVAVGLAVVLIEIAEVGLRMPSRATVFEAVAWCVGEARARIDRDGWQVLVRPRAEPGRGSSS